MLMIGSCFVSVISIKITSINLISVLTVKDSLPFKWDVKLVKMQNPSIPTTHTKVYVY